MKSAVLLLSSGLDSAANLALATRNEIDIKLTLTIDYGQRGAQKELEQARKLSAFFGIEHVEFTLSSFAELVDAKSALFIGQDSRLPSPLDLDSEIETKESAKAVWVPNRNAVMLSLAASLAESRGIQAVCVGFNVEEAQTFPDNSIEYMKAMTVAFKYSTANHVEVVSSTAEYTKEQIVERLSHIKFPFDLIWSCYRAPSSSLAAHCGECESCLRLDRAIKRGLPEPLSQDIIKMLFKR